MAEIQPSHVVDETTTSVASSANTPQNASARVAPARVRRKAGDDGDAALSLAEIEQIAREIENGTPRANESIRSIIADYPRVRRLMVAAAVRSLGATRWRYCNTTKKHIVEPDFVQSFKACEFLADRVDGKPPQTTLNGHWHAAGTAGAGDVTPEKFEELLARSPAMREAVRRQLDRAEVAAAAIVEKPHSATPGTDPTSSAHQ